MENIELKKAATDWSEGFSDLTRGIAFGSFEAGARWEKEQQGEDTIPPFWKRVITALPAREVLAKNRRGEKLIGELYKHESGDVRCASTHEEISDVQLYLTTEDLSRLKAEK